MCYSGQCRMECQGQGYEGECVISPHLHQWFFETYGETACIVGGMFDDEESEEYIINNKERLDAIYKQWYYDAFLC